jgi:hypothetical protein
MKGLRVAIGTAAGLVTIVLIMAAMALIEFVLGTKFGRNPLPMLVVALVFFFFTSVVLAKAARLRVGELVAALAAIEIVVYCVLAILMEGSLTPSMTLLSWYALAALGIAAPWLAGTLLGSRSR